MRVLVLAACLLLFAGCPAGSLPGGRYTCTFDGGLADSQQCPGDFRCGLEGYCHHDNDTSIGWWNSPAR